MIDRIASIETSPHFPSCLQDAEINLAYIFSEAVLTLSYQALDY